MNQRTSTLEIDEGMAEQFVASIFARDDIVETRCFTPESDPVKNLRKWVLAADFARTLDSRHTQCEVYISINPRKAVGGGKTGDVALARCLYADFDEPGIDEPEVLRRIAAAGLPEPSFVIASGNGIHAYWLLEEPLFDLDYWEELQDRLAITLNSDPDVTDRARVMRLPGTFNWREKVAAAEGKTKKVPTDKPKPCRIIRSAPARHDVVQFEIALPELQKKAPVESYRTVEYDKPDEAQLWKRLAAYIDTTDPAIEGSKGSTATFRALSAVVDAFDLDETWTRRAANYFNETKCEPPWPERQLEHKIRDALKQKGTRRQVGSAFAEDERRRAERSQRRHPMMPPGGYDDCSTPADAINSSLDAAVAGEPGPHDAEAPNVRDRLNESEFSKRVAQKRGKLIRWVNGWNKFYAWTGQVWAPDGGPRVDGMIRAEATSRLAEVELAIASGALGGSGAKESLKFARYLNSSKGKNAIRDFLKSEPGIAVEPEAFDADPFLLNVQNGVVDLRTGELRPHDPALLQSKIAATIYDPNAKFPTWIRVLSEVFNGSQELIGYMRRALGYMLTGDVREHKLFIWWGDGGNGKGTIVETIMGLMGEYAAIGAPDLLMVKGESHPTEIATLAGHRLVVCSETEDGKRLAEARVKQFTGGDTLTARRCKEDFWEFHPTHKLVVLTNYKPALRGTDAGIRRRINLVPFAVQFPEDKQDKLLPDKLRAEWPGILQWLIAGCLEWQGGGLEAPEEVTKATADYIASEDVIGRFITDVCKQRPDDKIRAGVIYNAYRDWCSATGERYVTQKAFGQSIEKRGHEKETSNGVWYLGIWCPTPAPKTEAKAADSAPSNGSKNQEPLEPSGSDDDDRATQNGGREVQRDILDE